MTIPQRYEINIQSDPPTLGDPALIPSDNGNLLLYADTEEWVAEREHTISRLRSDLCDRGISWGAALTLCKEKEEEIALLKNEHDEALRKSALDQKQCDEITSEAARLAEEIAVLTAHVDLMLDEFVRIAACPGVTDEIKGLCVRGQQGIEQSVPIIVQRNKALKEITALKAELSLNASMLARQCDLAREAETELESHVWKVSPAMAQAKIGLLSEEIAALKEELKEAYSKNEKLLLFANRIAKEGQHDLGSNKLCDCVLCRIIQGAAKECI